MVELYKDEVGDHRWRVRHENGEIVADSSEGYVNQIDCKTMVDKLFPNLPQVPEE